VLGGGVRCWFSSQGAAADAACSLIPSFGSNPTGDASGEEDLTEFSTGAGELARLMVTSGVAEILKGIDG